MLGRNMSHILISCMNYIHAIATTLKLIGYFFQKADASEDNESSHDTTNGASYYYLLKYIPKLSILMINSLVQGFFER